MILILIKFAQDMDQVIHGVNNYKKLALYNLPLSVFIFAVLLLELIDKSFALRDEPSLLLKVLIKGALLFLGDLTVVILRGA